MNREERRKEGMLFERDFEQEKEKWDKELPRIKELQKTAESFVRARNPYELKYFVVGRHVDKVQQYKQLLVEFDSKLQALEEAQQTLRLKDLEIEEKELELIKEPKDRKEEIHNDKIRLEIDKLEREQKRTFLAQLGALEECKNFTDLAKTEYHDLLDKSEDELLLKEKDYWKKRFARQLQIDLIANGRISAGNAGSLLQMPKEDQKEILIESSHYMKEYEQLVQSANKKFLLENAESRPRIELPETVPDYLPLKLLKDAPEWYPQDRIVQWDVVEIMIATLHRPEDQWWCSETYWIPKGKNYVKHWVICPNGDEIGEYKSKIVLDALSLGCTHLFIVDDDVLCDYGVLQRLYTHNKDIVGAFYVAKTDVPECASMYKNGISKDPFPLDSEGLHVADWALAGGCVLYKTEIFKKIPYPFFKTGSKFTEDTYGVAKFLKEGYTPYLDCDIRVGHIDKQNKIVYWPDGSKEKFESLDEEWIKQKLKKMNKTDI